MTPQLLKDIRVRLLYLSQAEMADAFGVSQGTLSKWEAGTSGPDFKGMCRVRDALKGFGVDYPDEWFFAPPVDLSVEMIAKRSGKPLMGEAV